MWYPALLAEGLPCSLRCGPQHEGRATSAQGQYWEQGHRDLAGPQHHCPAWTMAKGQCQQRWLDWGRKDKHVSPAGGSLRDKLGLEGVQLPPHLGLNGEGQAAAGTG